MTHKAFCRAGQLAALLLMAGASAPAFAQSCKSDGGLAYLGNTRDASRSVWLSATVPGSFDLEAAQGNTTVDTWSRETRGLHLSTSPFVSSGNGGTHRLFNTGGNKPCLIDTQNQKRDFALPNIRPPGNAVPPIGNFFPEFGGLTPSRPGLGQINLPQLPGSGPSGLTPSRPGVPSLPGGAQPPIATLPPSGVTPGLPGAVQPPIATLPPPSGLTPSRPGVPSLPGGAQPPIATLPPSGVTPGLPGARPSVVTLPPVGQRGARLAAAGSIERCIDPRSPTAAADREVVDVPICPQEILAEIDALRVGPDQVPLTEGRELGPPSLWNVWAEGSVIGISDERFGLDMNTTLGTGTFGIDRRMSDDVVLGVSFSVQNSSTDGFGDFLQADTKGFNFGPYMAVRLSPHWAIDGSLTYGQYDNDIELAVLSGSYTSRQYGGSINLHGQYKVDEYFLRPKASVSYSHIVSDGYDLNGNVFGLPVDIRFPDDSFNYGVVEASTEISRIFSFSDGTQMVPFAEIGAQYEFERPNGGEILTGDLSLATPSPWSGSVRTGVRMLIKDSFQLEASAGYLSFGQNGLDVWEGKLHLSYGF